ncbi:hypothetical protein CNR22_11890 [Sphingobacteriaceae bacterium]|nr:hypothetical protein CNR22_11890 [Sphingobacteriaceae bacterium]
MRKLKLSICLFLIVIFSTECTDVVQIKLDEGSELVVIDAFLESQYDLQSIFIHKNSTYFNTQKPEPIVNAKVTLHDLTANISYKGYYARDDRYELSAEKKSFVVGHQYKLEVEIDGVVYSALTTQPRAAKIDSIEATYYDKDQFTGQSTYPYYMCTLWAKDKVDEFPDYYWIKTDNDTSFNLCIDGSGGIVKNVEQDSLNFTPPYSLLGFKMYRPGTGCAASINAITRDTYNFLIQAQAQINNGGLFATTPENVKTNFVTPAGAKTKAVGWFSIANVDKLVRTIPY